MVIAAAAPSAAATFFKRMPLQFNLVFPDLAANHNKATRPPVPHDRVSMSDFRQSANDRMTAERISPPHWRSRCARVQLNVLTVTGRTPA
ncbi:hypothetical protein ACFC06_18145 [Nocardia sp. NPDC056064]|uniref:hypothetical protein n=1 Tax=Nocardia sp. NPDC056064 TaxID=3345701 RepID=UPI0035DE2404